MRKFKSFLGNLGLLALLVIAFGVRQWTLTVSAIFRPPPRAP